MPGIGAGAHVILMQSDGRGPDGATTPLGREGSATLRTRPQRVEGKLRGAETHGQQFN